MPYVEFVRVRTALKWFAVVIVALIVLIFISVSGGGKIVVNGDVPSGPLIPAVFLFGIAAYTTAIFATIVGTSLNKENDGLHFVFVKPISRQRLALSYFLTDLIGLVIAYIAVLFAIGGFLTAKHLLGSVFFGPTTFVAFCLTLGIGVMWYAVLQAVTAGFRGKGGTLAGLSWAIFSFLALLGAFSLPPVLHAIVLALNVINPLAYLTSLSSLGNGSHGSAVTMHSVFAIDIWARVALVWGIAALGCVVATLSWKRLEA